MEFVLGPNRYGKAETHLVHVVRDGARHRVRDLTVGVALSGDLAGTHLTGDNTNVLPTDTQKNTVFAFAREHGVSSPEAFALLLARHFVSTRPAIRYARVEVTEAAWDRLTLDGIPAPHSFSRNGSEVRTALVTYDGTAAQVVSGLRDLVVLNSTGSQFWGYDTDRYTTLEPAHDRILATSVTARWRHSAAGADDLADVAWDDGYAATRADLLTAFAATEPSLSLQQTLFAMGRAVLTGRPELDEVRLALPNRHHFLVNLEPFGLDNPNEVFYAADRPYGLIEGTVRRGGGPEDGGPGNGGPGNGGPANGDPANGDPSNGRPGNGAEGPASSVTERDQDW